METVCERLELKTDTTLTSLFKADLSNQLGNTNLHRYEATLSFIWSRVCALLQLTTTTRGLCVWWFYCHAVFPLRVTAWLDSIIFLVGFPSFSHLFSLVWASWAGTERWRETLQSTDSVHDRKLWLQFFLLTWPRSISLLLSQKYWLVQLKIVASCALTVL